MPDNQTYLQAMYKEQCDQARQHESMRQQSTNLVLGLSAALATAQGAALSATVRPLLDGKVPWVLASYALVGWVVVSLAGLGQGLSLKHYERSKLHVARARQYRGMLEALFPAAGYDTVIEAADADHESEWASDHLDPAVIRARLHLYWNDIYVFVKYLGIALIIVPIATAIALTFTLQ